MVSIEEVARAAGVSTATVSRALSGRGQVSPKTRERVSTTARALGYTVSSAASSLATGRTMCIGVIVPFIDRWFFNSVLSGASDALGHAGYDLTLYNVSSDPAARRAVFDSVIHRRRVDGMIAVSLELDAVESEQLARLDIPAVAIGGPSQNLPALSIDDTAIARLATDHLIALGHRRIAHLGGDPAFDLDFHIPTRRRQGYEQALMAADIPVEPALYAQADFTIESGYAATKQLLGRPDARMTALFAASDEMAIGAVLAARDLGFQIPRDLSVIGIDGHSLGGFFGLTTVDQFPHAQGERAVQAILAELGGQPMVAGELPFELVVRSTTAMLTNQS